MRTNQCLLLCLTLLGLVACTQPDPPAIDKGFIKATVDGREYMYKDGAVFYTYGNDRLMLMAGDASRLTQIVITTDNFHFATGSIVPQFNFSGTMWLSLLPPKVYIGHLSTGPMQLNITTATQNRLTGNFSFVGQDSSGVRKSITDGSFDIRR